MVESDGIIQSESEELQKIIKRIDRNYGYYSKDNCEGDNRCDICICCNRNICKCYSVLAGRQRG